MTTTNSNLALTDYQKAVLTHMGITPWVERSALSSGEESTSLPNVHEAKALQIKPTAASNSASQEEKLAGLQKLKQQIVDTPAPSPTRQPRQVELQDAQMAMVLCMDKAASQHAIVQDVVNTLAHLSNNIIVSEQPIDTYTNFSFAWQLGDDISFSNKVLTTPAIHHLSQGQLKKSLWHHLSRGM